MADPYLKYYPANVGLDKTRLACETEQNDPEPTDPPNPDNDGRPSQLTKIEAVVHDKEDKTTENLNEATFKKVDNFSDVLNELLFFDVSTVEGRTAALQAAHDHVTIGGPGAEFQIWVNNKRTPVQVLGKTT